jgi:homoserine dehydrogenase
MSLRVGLIGFGTVGKSVARLLLEQRDGLLRLTHICNRNVARKRADWVPADVHWTENVDDLIEGDPDVIVELVGGLEPAGAWVARALEAGKAVVTANKQLIATRGTALAELACRHRTQLAFEAAVGGGIPVVRGLGEGVAGDRLRSIAGILNGTCNFMLTRMETGGVGYSVALREAQERGYAEADPTDDVDGFDARAKLCILARVGLSLELAPDTVPCGSIRPIDHVDFIYAHRLGKTIRQVSRVEMADHDGRRVRACAGPALVPLASPLASITGSRNIVMTIGDYGSETLFAGHGAGGNPTAVAVVSDLIVLARHGLRPPSGGRAVVRPDHVQQAHSPFYLRLVVNDRPGIIASLAAILSSCDINIDAVLQEPGVPKTALPFVVTVEECPAETIDRAIADIARLDFNVQPPLAIPMLA